MARLATPSQIVEALRARDTGGPIGLAFDFDGTLVGIVARPELATLDAPTREGLLAVTRLPRAHVALITGRSFESLRSVAGELPGIALAVNGGVRILNGGDWTVPEAAAARPLLASAVSSLRTIVARWSGALLEDKGLSLTVHYRLRPEAAEPLEAEGRRIVESSNGRLRILDGKMSFELQPNIAWDKGHAIAHLLVHWGVGTACLFLGDDHIDEPALAAVRQRGGVSVLVAAEPRETAAEWRLPSVEDTHEVMRLLTSPSGPRPS